MSGASLDDTLDRLAATCTGEIGLAARNLTTGEVILRNADKIYPTASTIKLAILVEVMRLHSEGRLDLGERMPMARPDIVPGGGVLRHFATGLQPTISDLGIMMIIVSDNTATNMLIDRVGGVSQVNETLQQRLGFETVVLHSRIDHAHISAAGVRAFAEASPRDMMNLMAAIAQDRVFGSEVSARLRAVLAAQQYLDQFPRYFRFSRYGDIIGHTRGLEVMSKNGDWPGMRADVGIVAMHQGNSFSYAVVCDECEDLSMSVESEPMVVNGLVGRAVLSHWWPESAGAVPLLPTPHDRPADA